jgi:hypothetical protein
MCEGVLCYCSVGGPSVFVVLALVSTMGNLHLVVVADQGAPLGDNR